MNRPNPHQDNASYWRHRALDDERHTAKLSFWLIVISLIALLATSAFIAGSIHP